MGYKDKRAWDDPDRVTERAHKEAAWDVEVQAKRAKVEEMVGAWNAQSQAFRTDFLGTYACSDVGAAELARESLGIVVQSDASCPGFTPAPMQSWSEMPILPAWITKSLQEHQWHAPMPVQAQAFPILLAGRNLVGIAQTGSGKTIAFMLPAVIHASDQRPLAYSDQGPIVLVLAPTRELAVQIAQETEKLTKHSSESSSHPNGLSTTCFYGGGKKWAQLQKFSNVGSHVVVATPGRLLDCIAEGQVSLSRVTYFCLDEADRMLDLGFHGDMEQLSSIITPDKQMAFFSATWPKAVQGLAHNLSTGGEPVTIRVAAIGRVAGGDDIEELQTAEGICQEVVMIPDLEGGRGKNKWGRQDDIKKELLDAHLKQAMASDPDSKVLIFVNDKAFADELSGKLWDEGVHADCIHGGRPQERRLQTLDDFRQGKLKILVATDVIGRGLDIPNVTHVVVFDMNGVADYVHRIGRTGRGVDGTGHALVFFEYSDKAPEIAGELVDVLTRSGQEVPSELRKIADEVASGIRVSFYDKKKRMGNWNSGSSWQSSGSTWNNGSNGWNGS